MNPINLSEGPRVSNLTLVVCDAAGRIVAVSPNAPQEIITCSPVAQRHFTEVFGEKSELTNWLTEHLRHARRAGDYSADQQLENGSRSLHVRLETLRCDEELYGFALTFASGRPPPAGNQLEDGDSVVSRKQWHEIKNYIGAMKLYATFLTKKLPEGEERQTIEKMLNGINNLIDYLARIRRGESK